MPYSLNRIVEFFIFLFFQKSKDNEKMTIYELNIKVQIADGSREKISKINHEREFIKCTSER